MSAPRKLCRQPFPMLVGATCGDCGSDRVVALRDESVHGPAIDGCLDCEATWLASETNTNPYDTQEGD